jgi:hypothetical protein
MMPLSRRHLPLALGIVLVSAVWVAVNVFLPRHRDDCQDPTALLDTARIHGSSPLREVTSRYGRGVFQWSEGDVAAESGPARYTVVRSYRPNDLYHLPLRALGSVLFLERTTREWIEVDGLRVPIRFAYLRLQDAVHAVGYLFVYEGRPLDLLLPRQLATAFPQLFQGTRPLTLYRIDSVAGGGDTEPIERLARAWLGAAWRVHREACAP